MTAEQKLLYLANTLKFVLDDMNSQLDPETIDLVMFDLTVTMGSEWLFKPLGTGISYPRVDDTLPF